MVKYQAFASEGNQLYVCMCVCVFERAEFYTYIIKKFEQGENIYSTHLGFKISDPHVQEEYLEF